MAANGDFDNLRQRIPAIFDKYQAFGMLPVYDRHCDNHTGGRYAECHRCGEHAGNLCRLQWDLCNLDPVRCNGAAAVVS